MLTIVKRRGQSGHFRVAATLISLCGGEQRLFKRGFFSISLPDVCIDEAVLNSTLAKLRRNESDAADLIDSLKKDFATERI
jgi:hypothetical protein